MSPSLGAVGGSGLEMKDLYLEFCLCPMISEDSNGGSIRIIPRLLLGSYVGSIKYMFLTAHLSAKRPERRSSQTMPMHGDESLPPDGKPCS